MKFVNEFNSFMSTTVNLNDSRLAGLEQRVTAIGSFVGSHDLFRERIVDVVPAGSWAHGTIIRPVRDNDEYDADVLLQVAESGEWDPKDYIENLYTAFKSSGTYAEKAHRMTRCVRIDYSGDVHVDVVPYIERDIGNVIANRLDPAGIGSFEPSNPEGFTSWVDDRQRWTGGQFSKVVRLVKYLRDHKDTFTCKSIILTTLVGELVTEYDRSEGTDPYPDTPTALKHLLRRLADSLPADMPAVYDPAGTGDNFTDRYRDEWNYPNFRSRIAYYADKVDKAYESEDREQSARLWREVFGDAVIPASTTSASAVAERSIRASVPVVGESFIDRFPFDFPIRLEPGMYVRIRARCTGLSTGQIFRRQGFRAYDLPTRGNKVHKSRSITFRATTNVPGATLYWKVRNGGEEAAATAGGLRGEIREDNGKGIKTETTSYRGHHYVECYAVRAGRVVAQARQVVIVTG